MNLDNNRSLIAIQGPKSVEILNSILNGVDQLNFMTGNWFDSDNQNYLSQDQVIRGRMDLKFQFLTIKLKNSLKI